MLIIPTEITNINFFEPSIDPRDMTSLVGISKLLFSSYQYSAVKVCYQPGKKVHRTSMSTGEERNLIWYDKYSESSNIFFVTVSNYVTFDKHGTHVFQIKIENLIRGNPHRSFEPHFYCDEPPFLGLVKNSMCISNLRKLCKSLW